MVDTLHGFDKKCFKVAKGFLQSVVVLDDEAWMGAPPPLHEAEVSAPLRDPEYSVSDSEPSDDAADRTTTPKIPSGNSLNAKIIVDQFAQYGLICAVLNPKPPEDDFEQKIAHVAKAAVRADIVVLDWKIGNSYGVKTLEVIERILKKDKHSERLRLFAIYTGEPDLGNIAEKVKTTIDEFYKDKKLNEIENKSRMRKRPVYTVILAKEGTKVPEVCNDQVVTEKKLAKRLITEFSMMTGGLLRNVALEGFSALRNNVHRLLARFDPTLDSAYLGHRLLLPNPADAEEHIVAALGAELLAILEEQRPGAKADIEAIKAWLDKKKEEGLKFSIASNDKCENVEKVVELLCHGISNVSNQTINKTELRKSATEIFTDKKSAATCFNCQFSALLGLKTRYLPPAPQLTLGAILREGKEDNGQYLLCLQPKCDSVRLESETGFPLLRLRLVSKKPKKHEKEAGRFNLVVKVDDEWKYLCITPKPKHLIVRSFKPDSGSSGRVVASKSSDSSHFKDTKGAEYRWIAEMKDEHALKVAGELAASLARPGPNGSEWLRLASVKV